MGEGGQQSYRVKVSTGASVAALDTLTQAAVVARGAIRALNQAGGQAAMQAAAVAARANADAQKAMAQAQAAVAAQAKAAAPLIRAQAAETVAAARAEKLNAEAARAMAQADKIAGDAARQKGQATVSATDAMKSGAQAVQGYANQVLDLAQKAGDAAKQLYDFAAEGQKLKQLETAFKTLGGNAKEMEKLRAATGGVVDDATLQRVYNLGSLFELPKQHIPELIRLAKGASVALGTTVAKSLEDTFTAASRQSKMIADNMGIVIGDLEPRYAEFAKKAGKSVESLTDKEKQLVFIQTMIAKGGRQVDLASAASSNAFASAEAELTNFTNSLKMGMADMFKAGGGFEAMGNALDVVKKMFAENGSQISAIVMPAFNAVVQILPQVGGLFATLLPVLQPLTQALGTVSVVLQLVTPLLGVAIGAFSGLANIILQLVNVVLMALLKALKEVASLFSDDMANAIQKAVDTLDRGLPATEAQTAALAKQKEEIEKTANAWNILDEVRRRTLVEEGKGKSDAGNEDLLAARLGVTPERLAQINADIGDFNAKLNAQFEYYKGSMQAKMEGLDKVALAGVASGMSQRLNLTQQEADAVKQIIQRKYDDMRTQEELNTEKTFSDATASVAKMEAMFQDSIAFRTSEITKGAKSEKEERQKLEAYYKKHMDNVRTVYGEGAQAMYHDSLTYQNSTLADMMMQGAKNEKEALEKLDTYYADHLSKIQMLYGQNAELLAEKEAILAAVVNDAAQKIDEDTAKKDKGRGGRGPDYAKAIEDAKAALMEESERNIYDIKKKYEEMSERLPKKEKDLRVALAQQAQAEIINLEEERRRREEEAQAQSAQRAREEARALSDFLMSEGERRYQQSLRAIQDEANARRAGAGTDPVSQAMIAAREQMEISKLQGATLREVFEGAFSERFKQYGEDNAKELEKARKNAQHWASTFQSAGSSVVGTMFEVAQGTGDMRESMFKMMGSLFGQLSTAYLAWANTEIAMFSGNPWLGAVAAVALGAVASAISSFGSRGKGSGGAAASGGAVSREIRNRESDEKKQASVTINAYGMATPDSIARAVARGELRGNELTGRKAA